MNLERHIKPANLFAAQLVFSDKKNNSTQVNLVIKFFPASPTIRLEQLLFGKINHCVRKLLWPCYQIWPNVFNRFRIWHSYLTSLWIQSVNQTLAYGKIFSLQSDGVLSQEHSTLQVIFSLKDWIIESCKGLQSKILFNLVQAFIFIFYYFFVSCTVNSLCFCPWFLPWPVHHVHHRLINDMDIS